MSDSDNANKIAIIGMACHFPGASTPLEYWQNLRNDTDNRVHYSKEVLLDRGVPAGLLDDPNYVMCAIPLEQYKAFDPEFFGINQHEAALMDPQHRHFLACCYEALDVAGYASSSEREVGVFGGSGHNAYMPFNLLTNSKVMRDSDLLYVRHTSNDKDFMTTRVSYCLDLRGPSINVQTACSTSLVAIHMACQSLLNGECDMALAGGCTIEVPHESGYLYRQGEVFSPDGICRAFDAKSNGTLFGSGAGVVLLKLLDDALADGDPIDGIILGSAINNDGSRKAGYMAPSVEGQIHAAAEALDVAGIDAGSIRYLESHGTGTAIGDPIEVDALNEAYGSRTELRGHCALGSVKPNIGHLDTAAGVASLIKAVMALKHAELPALMNFSAPNPECDFQDSPFFVSGDWQPWPSDAGTRRAAVSSLGVGGTNAHIVLEQAPAIDTSVDDGEVRVINLSARSESELDAVVSRMGDFARAGNVSLKDISHTLQTRSRDFSVRTAIVADSVEALADKCGLPTVKGVAGAQPRACVFMFAGGGSQEPGMARELAAQWPGFKDRLQQCLDLMPPDIGAKLDQLLYAQSGERVELNELFQDPRYAVPAIFATQYSLAKLLSDDLGIEPHAMIGHSLGDYAAATLAGVFSLSDAIRIVCLRGEITGRLTYGAMTSVLAAEAELQPLLEIGVEIASLNTPNLSVISGSVDQIERAEQRCEELGIDARRVPVRSAGHCSLLDPYLAEYRALLDSVELHAPSMDIMCNATGVTLTAEQARSAEYWQRHLRETVRFAQGISALKEQDAYVYLEVGPGATLTSFVRQFEDVGHPAATVTTMRAVGTATDNLLYQALGELWSHGVELDWSKFQQAGYMAGLPSYPFNQREFWIDADTDRLGLYHDDHSLAARAPIDEWIFQAAWNSRKSTETPIQPNQSVLLFHDGSKFSDLLSKQFELDGSVLDVVRLDEWDIQSLGFRNDDALEKFDHLINALDALKNETGMHIVYAWPLARTAFLEQRMLAFDALANLAYSLARSEGSRPVNLSILLSQQFSVAGEPVVEPLRSLAVGASRVIASEVDRVKTQIIDIGPLPQYDKATSQFRQIAEACLHLDQSNTLWQTSALRNGLWFHPEFSPVSVQLGLQQNIHAGAVYVVTGGTGFVAQHLVRKLIRDHGAAVLLLVRDERRFPDHLRKEFADQLQVIKADLKNGEEVRSLVSHAAGGRPVRGVFHAAGYVQDELIQLKSPGAIDSVFEPKLDGSQTMVSLCEEHPLDFVLLFSSLSVEMGLQGQIDYAAVNAYVDAYAVEQRLLGCPVMAVAWDAWENASSKIAGREQIVHPLFDSRQKTAERVEYDLVVSTERHWMLDEHRNTSGTGIVPGTGYINLAAIAYLAESNTSVADCHLTITDATFIELFAIADHTRRHLSVELSPATGGDFEFAITSESGSRVHAQGRVGPLTGTIPQIELADCLENCPSVRPVDEAYVDAHVLFGARWHNVVSYRKGESHGLLELHLAPEFNTDLDVYPIHPAILDIATAGAQSLAGLDPEEQLLVPFAYARMDVYKPLTGAVSSAVQLVENRQASEFVNFEVHIFDTDSGTLLVHIANFQMRRVSPHAIDDAHADPLSDDQELGIAPEEGMYQIDRILNCLHLDRVVVSPQSPDRIVDECNTPPEQIVSEGSSTSTDRPNISTPFVPPTSEVELAIASIWQRALGYNQVGVQDNFFELGGHSLLLTRVCSQCQRELKRKAPMETLFESPVIQDWARVFAEQAQSNVKDAAPIKRVARKKLSSQS